MLRIEFQDLVYVSCNLHGLSSQSIRRFPFFFVFVLKCTSVCIGVNRYLNIALAPGGSLLSCSLFVVGKGNKREKLD